MKILIAVLFLLTILVACGGNDPEPKPQPGIASVKIGTPALPETTYSWSPGDTLDNFQFAEPTASPKKTTTYTVTAKTKCGAETSAVTVRVLQRSATGELVEIK